MLMQLETESEILRRDKNIRTYHHLGGDGDRDLKYQKFKCKFTILFNHNYEHGISLQCLFSVSLPSQKFSSQFWFWIVTKPDSSFECLLHNKQYMTTRTSISPIVHQLCHNKILIHNRFAQLDNFILPAPGTEIPSSRSDT